MNKEQIVKKLKDNFISLNDWLQEHDDVQFGISLRKGKWTTGQHIDHLIRSIAPLNKIYRLPKFALKWKFGVNNRQERSYEETYLRYVNTLKEKGIKAKGRFVPDLIKNSEKPQKVMELKCQYKTFGSLVNKQSEKNLSKYIIPHPALGYLTLREMAYFTALHIDHHHQILKKYH